MCVCKTHQVCLGHVLVVRRVVCCRFPKAIVACGLRWLSVLSVCGALWSPAEKVDGLTNATLNVDFCATKRTERNMEMLLANVGVNPNL